MKAVLSPSKPVAAGTSDMFASRAAANEATLAAQTTYFEKVFMLKSRLSGAIERDPRSSHRQHSPPYISTTCKPRAYLSVSATPSIYASHVFESFWFTHVHASQTQQREAKCWLEVLCILCLPISASRTANGNADRRNVRHSGKGMSRDHPRRNTGLALSSGTFAIWLEGIAIRVARFSRARQGASAELAFFKLFRLNRRLIMQIP